MATVSFSGGGAVLPGAPSPSTNGSQPPSSGRGAPPPLSNGLLTAAEIAARSKAAEVLRAAGLSESQKRAAHGDRKGHPAPPGSRPPASSRSARDGGPGAGAKRPASAMLKHVVGRTAQKRGKGRSDASAKRAKRTAFERHDHPKQTAVAASAAVCGEGPGERDRDVASTNTSPTTHPSTCIARGATEIEAGQVETGGLVPAEDNDGPWQTVETHRRLTRNQTRDQDTGNALPPSANGNALPPSRTGARRKPKWGLKLVLEQGGMLTIRTLSSRLDKAFPTRVGYTIRQVGELVFVLTPASVGDNNLLLQYLKQGAPVDLGPNVKYRVEVPELQRAPKQRSYAVIAKGLDKWTSEEDIEAELRDHGLRSVTRVERFRQGDRVLPLCRIEFSAQAEAAKLLADGLYVGRARFRCEPPHDKTKPIQCFKCLGYGHVRAACPVQEAKCLACGDAAHTEKGAKCDRVRKCANCNGEHLALYRGCPVYKEALLRANEPTGRRVEQGSYAAAVKPATAAVPNSNVSVPQTIQTVLAERDRELCSKITAFLGTLLGRLFSQGFMASNDPACLGARSAQAILGIVSESAEAHLGLKVGASDLMEAARSPKEQPLQLFKPGNTLLQAKPALSAGGGATSSGKAKQGSDFAGTFGGFSTGGASSMEITAQSDGVPDNSHVLSNPSVSNG